ncbi:MAG: FAD-binding protein, partial [Deltaproteobacteria bacterium]|nr:FAD-binding protein [Deltaproteobacteria bacterium]
VAPTAHYSMDGIPTNRFAEVCRGSMTSDEDVVPGFYAAGECACASVHGANRLGTNSLLDIVVFGKIGGQRMREYARSIDFVPLASDAGEKGRAEVESLFASKGREKLGGIMLELQESMDRNCGVFRTEESLTEQKAKMVELRTRFRQVGLDDKGRAYNLELIETLELGHMLEVASALVEGALARKESRGGHCRDDFPKRDDENWLKHSMAYLEPDGGIRLDYKPVRLKPLTVDSIAPKERVY